MPDFEGSKIRILLIEDDADDYLIIHDLLDEISLTRYELSWADNYGAALQKFTAGDFDVCLLDYLLGDRNGLDLLQEVAGNGNKAPVIILTGQANYAVDLEAMRSGAADFLVKGQINANLLERSIRYAIEHKRNEEKLRESERQLHYLSSQLLIVQENERRKIANELHDNIGQILTAIKFMIENVLDKGGIGSPYQGSLEVMVPKIQDAIAEVRSMYTELRPTVLDDLGIVATLAWYCREFEEKNPGITIGRKFEIAETDVPQELKLTIFRIVQEAMNNIAVHSGASWAKLLVRISAERGLELEIEDNGDGFDAQGMLGSAHIRGLGIISMRKRAELSQGFFEIDSSEGSGTAVRVHWPMAGGPADGYLPG